MTQQTKGLLQSITNFSLIVVSLFTMQILLASETTKKMYQQEKMVLEFSKADNLKPWRIVNDGVMGGLSVSEIKHGTDGTLIFTGNISLENNGGFASTRSQPMVFDLANYEGALLKVRGDGKTYQFRIKTDDLFDSVSYRHEFKTIPGKWITVDIPFSKLVPVFRGRVLDDIDPVKPEDIRQIGFLISKKQAGGFHLEIDWVKSYKK